MTSVLPRIFLISLKLYGPLYLAWNAVLLRIPARHFLENVIRSSLFLTGYTCTQYLLVMWFQSLAGHKISRLQHMSFAWLSGLWTLLERKERRPELAGDSVARCRSPLSLSLSFSLSLSLSAFSRTSSQSDGTPQQCTVRRTQSTRSTSRRRSKAF